ncbi:MAG: hypothetical protein QM658_14670 [Gordonia sp. (in: high G+C Gram-positive bacteria)]
MHNDLPYRRLALAPDLHLTWSAHLLTVASSRWSPGIFVYDLEYLSVEVNPSRKGGVKIVLGCRGAQILFQVLRFDLDDVQFELFRSFVADMVAYREQMRAQEA